MSLDKARPRALCGAQVAVTSMYPSSIDILVRILDSPTLKY